MRSKFTTLVALLSLVPLVSLPAQTKHLVGSRVRITMPDTMQTDAPRDSAHSVVVTGQLIAFDDSTMSVRNEAGPGDLTVPLSRVQRFETRTGSNRGTSAMYGFAIGLGVGGILGYAGGEDCSGEAWEWCMFSRNETAVFGAVLGAVAGGIIGLIVGHGDRWQEAAVPARISVVPRGTRSISVSSTLRF